MKRKADLPSVFGSASRERRREDSPHHQQQQQPHDSTKNPIKPGQQTKDINEGMDRWRDIKNEFNNYIGGPTGQRNPNISLEALKKRAITPPTYILGKRYDQITRYGPSRAFRESAVTKRVATPERGNNFDVHSSSDPTTQHQQTEQKNKNNINNQHLRHEISYLDDEKNDPRTIGYRARKMKESKQEPWSRSNEKRVLRFGIDERTNGRGIVLKEHQAPGAIYKLPDEWEERAKRLRAQAASRPKPTLAGSTGPRGGVGPAPSHHRDFPGPGSYDIP